MKKDKPGQFTTEVFNTKVTWFRNGYKKAVKEIRKGLWIILLVGVIIGWSLAAILYA